MKDERDSANLSTSENSSKAIAERDAVIEVLKAKLRGAILHIAKSKQRVGTQEFNPSVHLADFEDDRDDDRSESARQRLSVASVNSHVFFK